LLPKQNNLGGTSADTVSATNDDPMSSLVVSLELRSDALLRALALVLNHHGATTLIQSQLYEQLHDYLDDSDNECIWLKRVKYVLAYPLAKYLHNEPPPMPEKPFSWFSSALKQWFNCRINSFNRRNTHLWYSWFQSKRACLPCSTDFISQTYDDHFKSLSKKDDGDDWTISEIFQDRTFIDVLTNLRRSITKLYNERDSFEKLVPSSSACFEQTRSDLGQYGELRRLLGYEFVFDAHFSILTSMSYNTHSYFGAEKRFNYSYEIRCFDPTMMWFSSSNSMRICSNYVKKVQNLSCTIQAIVEPLKVRVISKGESLPYYIMHPLQKAMHSSMRNMDCFRLIGTPFSATMISDLAERTSFNCKWFSIDYSAATDGLSWKYSKMILHQLICDLPKEDYDIAMSVLGPHKLFYPNKTDKVFKGVQQNGQLMGSILSFPILCLANLGVYLLNTQAWQSKWSSDHRLRHVLINGDDMLYAAPESLWASHISIGNKIGLKMSPGKAYVHKTYLNVNSISVHYDLSACCVRGVNTQPWRIDFLNTGLYFNQHKVMQDIDFPKYDFDDSGHLLKVHYGESRQGNEGLTSNLNSILQGCLPGKQTLILSSFLSLWRMELFGTLSYNIGKDIFTRNLFVSESLGGAGVVSPCGWKYRVTKRQKWLARCYFERVDALVTRQYPLPGYPLLSEETVDSPYRKVDMDDDDPRKIFSDSFYRMFKRGCGREVRDIDTNLGIISYSLSSRSMIFNRSISTFHSSLWSHEKEFWDVEYRYWNTQSI
jgi:hypothetical protein